MLRYENKKTGSLLNIPGKQKISEIDDWVYMIKMMIWNDERVMKHNMTRLATVLKEVGNAKERRDRNMQRRM